MMIPIPCAERGCGRPATHRVYWPGVPPWVVCERHQWIVETLVAHKNVKGVMFVVLGTARLEESESRDGR